MKLILKILKWISKFLVGILVIIILSGAGYRLFSSKPVPPGKLVDVNGTKLHIRADGQKNDLPTLVLEAGASGDTESFHWIAEGLKKKLRVVRYDRPEKWYSETSKDSLTSESYAHQLHKLLEKNGEKPPYILVGHSMGGPYNRIFRDLYPNEVKGLVFLDSSHPEQWKRMAPPELSKKRNALIKSMSIIADMGILGLADQIFGPLFISNDLPKECRIRSSKRFSYSGKVLRGSMKVVKNSNDILLRAGQTSSLDSLPVLVFTATEQYMEWQKEEYRNKGIDPDKEIEAWFEMQQELKELSTNGKQINIDASHSTIILKKENTEIINQEILLMAESL